MFRGRLYRSVYINSVLNIGPVGRRSNNACALCSVVVCSLYLFNGKKNPSVALKDLYECSYTTPFSGKLHDNSTYVSLCS